MQLDVGGRLDVARNQAEQATVVDQPREQLLCSREHAVALGLGHRLVQVVQAPLHQPGELGALGRPLHDRLKRAPADVGVGHAGVGELADVGRDPVDLVEGQPP